MVVLNVFQSKENGNFAAEINELHSGMQCSYTVFCNKE